MNRTLPDLSSLRPRREQALLQNAISRAADLPASGRARQQRTISSIWSTARRAGIGPREPSTARCSGWSAAGIARKVDFGDGPARASSRPYRHPRHFHLICSNCHSSSEFLSSDVESLLEENRDPRASSRPGRRRCRFTVICEQCSNRPPGAAGRRLDQPRWCSRATRCAWRSPPSAAGWSFYTPRRQPDHGSARPLRLPEAGRRGRRAPRHARDALSPADCRRSGPSKSRPPPFLFFQGRRQRACSPRAPSSCGKASTIRKALLIGIKCERGSHKFLQEVR